MGGACCRFVARRGLVLSAGVWSGQLLAAASGDARYSALLQPRRGHLLEVAAPPGMAPVRHGIMEAGYTKVGGLQGPACSRAAGLRCCRTGCCGHETATAVVEADLV